jgi:hypothetical protein
LNFRVALVVLVLGFIAVLLALGAISFVRWLRLSYPRHYRSLLIFILLVAAGAGLWMALEMRDRPTFHEGDVLTLGEPLAVRAVSAKRLMATTSCIVEIHEHLVLREVMADVLTAEVESNAGPTPPFCDIGAEVQFDTSWLQRYTLTRRGP